MAARCWRAAPSCSCSWAALLLCSWALVAAAAGGAARPRCEHTCSLELHGGGSASPSAPVRAWLNCSCSAADCPPLTVAYNSSIIPEAMAAAFTGVSPRRVSWATHPELNGTVDNSTVLRRPLLYFRGDGSSLVRFERPMVRGVRLPVGAEAHPNRFTILRFANVTATIVNGNFSDNAADSIVAVRDGSALDVLGLNAMGNRVGGGVLSSFSSTLAATNLVCTGNSATAFGGCVSAVNSSVALRRAILQNNTAAVGGAVYSEASNVTLVGCDVAFNSALTGGGIIAWAAKGSRSASTLVINDTRIVGNEARYVPGVDPEEQRYDSIGGGLYIGGARAVMHNTTIAGNNVRLDGGGIACYDCTLDLANATLVGNTATRYGGAVRAYDNATINISQSRFLSNSARVAGGALLWTAWADDTTRKAVGAVSVHGSEFANNRALSRGGAIAALPDGNSTLLVPTALAPLVLRGNTFDSNFAPAGAMLDVGLLFNLSLADNGATLDVGLLFNLSLPDNADMQLNTTNLTAYDFGVAWRKRKCLRGERQKLDASTYEMVCQRCAPFSYSLYEGLVTGDCPACPANGRCFGGAVIVSADGHWHGDCTTCNATCNYTLADVTRCPNMAACRHTAKVLESTHPYRVGINASAGKRVSLGGQYEAQQCNNSAYSGPLCGSCAAGYGQTAPFTCKRCLTKCGTAQQLDLAGISMLWVTYWLVQTALLLTTVAASLPASGDEEGSNKAGADCTVGIDDKAAAPSPRDSSALDNRPMQWSEVFKAVSIYQSYLMILLNLPVSWLPFASHSINNTQARTCVRHGEPKGSTVERLIGFVLTVAGLVNGAPASLDCLMAAHGLTWSPRNAAVFKALVNLAAIPLVHLASLLVLQLAWFFVGDAVTRITCAVSAWLWRWLRHGGRQPDEPASAPDPPTSRCKPEGRGHLGPFMRDRAVVSLLVVVFKFYPSLVHVALRMFMCVRIGPTRLWIVDVAVACPLGHATGEGAAAYAVGIVALILVTAWPLAIAGLLWGGAHTGQLAATGGAFRKRFGFLYLGARVDPSKFGALRWPGHKRSDSVKPLLRVTRQGRVRVRLHVDWDRLDKVLRRHIVLAWDAAVDVQRFALVAISLAVMLHEYYQVLLLCLALGLYLMLVLVVRPFSAPAVHRLTVAMLACLWLSCLGILCAITPAGMENPLLAEATEQLTAGQTAARDAQQALRTTVSWLLAVANGAVIAVAAVMLLVCLHRMCRPMWARLHAWLRRWIKKSGDGSAASERAVTSSRACCWC